MQLVVDSLLTNYQRTGKGKVIVLLHGWGDNSKGLIGLHKALATSYDVISLDLPGFGGTDAPPQTWGLDEYTRFVANFCKKLLVHPYAVLGHSNGGAIAVRGVAKQILVAEKLVLLASAGVRGQYKGRVKAARLLAKTGKIIAYPLPAGLKRKLRRSVYKTIGSDMLVAEHLQETFKKVVADDIREDAKHIKIPTLLLYGELDTATPPEWGKLLHENITGSEFSVISGAGHFVHLDAAETVTDRVKGFLA